MDLADEEKRALLELARRAIKSQLDNVPAALPFSSTDDLPSRGVFVTLRIGTDLRGCIGYVDSRRPIAETVEDVACKAAFEDPRFVPVGSEELSAISIEISILSPLEVVKDINSIEVGKHGLVMESGGRRGLLLPHVATEYGWDREDFLRHTAEKAGLPPESWRSGKMMICSFTTETFSEAEFQPH